MKQSRLYLALFLAWLLVPGCSSDDEGGSLNPVGELIVDAIIGNWAATNALFTTLNADPVLSRDVVADGGLCDLTVSPNRNFTLVIRNPGAPDPQIISGRFVPNGGEIDVFLDSDPSTLVRWEFTISGTDLTIDGPLDYDFESDGTAEASSALMQFVPN